MSSNVKQFGAGAIVSALFLFVITGVVGWVGLWASKVPTLEATFKSEVTHLNLSLKKLTVTADETNSQLKAYTEYHAMNLARITESLITHKYRIQELEKDCIENHNEIVKNRERVRP